MLEKITWNRLPTLDLPDSVREIVMQNWANPPLALREGMFLSNAAVDHLALAVESKGCALRMFDRLLATGGRVVDAPQVWPDEYDCDVKVDSRDRKFMASVAHPTGVQVTLLAPMGVGDLIWTSLRRAGGSTLHHLAVSTPDIHNGLRSVLLGVPGARQFSPLALDDLMSQVFIKFDADPRLLELVERHHGYEHGFTCANIKVLTQGERRSFDAQQS